MAIKKRYLSYLISATLSSGAFAQTAISNNHTASTQEELAQYINPLIGTYNDGNTSYGNKKPYVAQPMPMVLITPQMDYKYSGKDTYRNCGGDLKNTASECKDETTGLLSGFRLSHQGSQYGGLGDYGFFSLMAVPENFDQEPTNKNISGNSGDKYTPNNLNAPGAFDFKNEESKAYKYQVTFNNGIDAQVTATRRSGYFLFKNPNGNIKVVLSLPTSYDATKAERYGGNGSEINWNKETLDSFTGFTGSGRNSGEGQVNYGLPKDFKNYFDIKFYDPETNEVIPRTQ